MVQENSIPDLIYVPVWIISSILMCIHKITTCQIMMISIFRTCTAISYPWQRFTAIRCVQHLRQISCIAFFAQKRKLPRVFFETNRSTLFNFPPYCPQCFICAVKIGFLACRDVFKDVIFPVIPNCIGWCFLRYFFATIMVQPSLSFCMLLSVASICTALYHVPCGTVQKRKNKSSLPPVWGKPYNISLFPKWAVESGLYPIQLPYAVIGFLFSCVGINAACAISFKPVR